MNTSRILTGLALGGSPAQARKFIAQYGNAR